MYRHLASLREYAFELMYENEDFLSLLKVEMYSTKPREHLIECEPLSGVSHQLREDLDRILDDAMGFIDIMGVTLEDGETDPREGPKDELRKVQTILHELGKSRKG